MIILAIALVGLCLGSFINALVWRLRHKRDWVRERSECVHCGHTLAAKDLLPVVSWLMLRGKCRYCHKPIDDSPLTELMTSGLFVVSYLAWPEPLNFINSAGLLLWLSLLVILIALALYDLKFMILPDKLVLAAAAIVALHVFFGVLDSGPGYLTQSFGGLIAFGGLFYLLFQLSDGKWIGGGDVKLGFVLGAWLADYRLSLLAIFVASFMGTLLVAAAAIAKKQVNLKAKLPFGPLLILGTIVMTLCGAGLIDWYTSLLLGY